jgi:hypothetical protein
VPVSRVGRIREVKKTLRVGHIVEAGFRRKAYGRKSKGKAGLPGDR